MTTKKLLLTVTALVLGFGVAPMAAQDREQRREMESRLNELRDEMRQLLLPSDRQRPTGRRRYIYMCA